jgi:diaminobutyrate-2-oxoglutarate transaminase
VFEEIESNVRYYCRRWPVVFTSASGAIIRDESGREYLDFFSGAGALSYGHNNPAFIDVAIDHLRSGRIVQSVDSYTSEKRAFLEALRDILLAPRGLDMVAQFVGPTGATAVEAALQLAQRVTGRSGVVAFDGGYHGMSAGAACVSSSLDKRSWQHQAGLTSFLPYVSQVTDRDLSHLDAVLGARIGNDRPGALIIETTQGEGGARAFDPHYLLEVRRRCTRSGVIVIADEVQAGVGRTGPFFSFEGTGLEPDIVCLSKSLSGLGLPMAMTLVLREHDQWCPGEFTGTFRGPNLAFATATALLDTYWRSSDLKAQIARLSEVARSALALMASEFEDTGVATATVRGRGLLLGLDVGNGAIASAVADEAFSRGLLVETCGVGGGTIKLLPPLVIEDAALGAGLELLAVAVQTVADNWPSANLLRA